MRRALPGSNATTRGSGKSTFLRRVAFELCRKLRGTRPSGAPPFLAPNDKRFPILIRGADLAKLLAADTSPKPHDAPDWIPYFLARQSAEYKWGAGEDFFQHKLHEGGSLVILDGLDEAPERRVRERIARLLERSTQAFPKCDFLVSTRPQTNEGDSVLADFHQVRIGDLEPPEIATFFDHVARALALNDVESKNFKEGLKLALASRLEIREMARNPVMLTALAVLQHKRPAAAGVSRRAVWLHPGLAGCGAGAQGRPPPGREMLGIHAEARSLYAGCADRTPGTDEQALGCGAIGQRVWREG